METGSNLQGLIAQGRTVAETMEIAQDVARKLIESYLEHKDPLPQKIIDEFLIATKMQEHSDDDNVLS